MNENSQPEALNLRKGLLAFLENKKKKKDREEEEEKETRLNMGNVMTLEGNIVVVFGESNLVLMYTQTVFRLESVVKLKHFSLLSPFFIFIKPFRERFNSV